MLSLAHQDKSREALAFTLLKDGMILTAAPRAEAEPCVPEIEHMREQRVEVLSALDADVQLLFNGKVLNTSAKGFAIEYHAAVSGFSLSDLAGNKPLFHSYGQVWRPYDQKSKKRAAKIVLRSSRYLLELNGPRLRASPLAA